MGRLFLTYFARLWGHHAPGATGVALGFDSAKLAVVYILRL
jgi:hypothetical protein